MSPPEYRSQLRRHKRLLSPCRVCTPYGRAKVTRGAFHPGLSVDQLKLTSSCNAPMAAGSQFSPMSSSQINSRCRPYPACQSLGAIRNVAHRMCFPVHPAPRTRRAQRSVHQIPRAVVAAPERVDSGHVPPFEAWKTGAAIKKREDIKSILLLGAGPIVIGQVGLSTPRVFHASCVAADVVWC